MADNEINFEEVLLKHSVSVREMALKIQDVDNDLQNPDDEGAESQRKPNFAFFLGAGASYKSGIKLASQMMEDFKERIFVRDCPELVTKEEKDKWLNEQSWYCDAENKYSCLFERYDDKKIGRQRYIERLLRKAKKPSFGYLMLSYLLANNYVNTILTTNFDDLAYISCVSFTGIRPIIYAYGIQASEMRLYSSRPKILKLHGDFLYSKIINTSDEMERMFSDYNLPVQNSALIDKLKEITSLDFNMTQQTKQILNQHSLVVVGYSGNDKTILKILEDIDPENNFYWCYRKSEVPNQKVLKLILEKRGKLVAIDGFDEMMSGIEKVISLKPDKLFTNFETQIEDAKESIAAYNPDYIKNFVSQLVKEDKEETEKSEQTAQTSSDETLSSDYVKLFYQALDAQNKGKKAEAESLYKKVIKLNPNFAVAYYNLGVLLADDQSRAAEAEEFCRKVIELNPNEVDAYDNLVFLLGKDESRTAEAIDYCRKVIELRPNDANAYNNLGILLKRDESRLAEVEAAYRKAIELKPDYATAYNDLGILLANDESQLVEAEKCYREAINLNASFAEAYYNLGVLLSRDKFRLAEAENYYREAIKYKPDNANAFYQLGRLIAQDDSRLAEAEKCYREAIRLNPHDGDIYYSLIFLLNFQGNRILDIFKVCEAASSNNIQHVNLFLYQAMLYKVDDENRSTHYAKAAEKLIKDNEWYALACLNSIRNNNAEALRYLELAVNDFPARKENAKTEIYFAAIRDKPQFKALVEKAEKESEIASDTFNSDKNEENYRKAIELNPEAAENYFNLANLLTNNKSRLPEAEELLRKAIEINPNFADAYYNLGDLLDADETRFEEAEECFQKVIELNPKYSSAYNGLGNLFSKDKSRLAEAEKMLLKAISLSPTTGCFFNNLGMLYSEQNNNTQAFGYITKGIALDTECPNHLPSLAHVYKKLDKNLEMQKTIDEAKNIIKKDDWYHLAMLESIQENKDEALKYLAKAIEADPSSGFGAKFDIQFDWIRDDPRFQELIG
ncbi:MAG TPA: tetratricopeptide repeat protein [Pyrinomonadaceae bacterium]|nr:tetratricopeptide repeat protein [Pyrinomonadaceae bacterium]